MLQDLANWYWQRHYAVLFYSLLLTLVLVPLQALIGSQGYFIQALLAFNLVAAVFDRRGGRLRFLFLLAAGFAILLRIGAFSIDYTHGEVVALTIWTVLALVAAIRGLIFSLTSKIITAEEIYAALSFYLIAGLFCGVLYYSIEQAVPGSFFISGEKFVQLSLADAIYFSFVTLATLGYGDIVPYATAPRALAAVQAVAGQLFLAVLVARLVSRSTVNPRD